MSDFTNSTMTSAPSNGDMSTATILSGTTVGITGLMALTYVINYLRKSGALRFLQSVGIRVPINTTARTDEEKRDDDAAANTALGKAAAFINKVKEEKKEILKVVDSLPLPEQLKYTAHNPKSLLSKSAQNKLESAERDIEKALPTKKTVAEAVKAVKAVEEAPKINVEALLQFQQMAESLGLKLPPNLVEKVTNKVIEQPPGKLEEDTEDYTEALEDSKQEEPEVEEEAVEKEKEVPEVVVVPAPVPAPAPAPAPTTAKKSRGRKAQVKAPPPPSPEPEPAKKATIEVNEHELEEIRNLLAAKKKEFSVI